MDPTSIYSQKTITMERGVRDKFATDKMSSAKNLACEYESEKRQLQSLNENFYNYLARVKQMEATNHKLENELRNLRERWGFATVEIRNQKDKELDDLRADIDDAECNKNMRQLELRSSEYNSELIQAAIRFLNLLANDDVTKIKDLEGLKRMLAGETADWQRRNGDIEAEVDKLRNLVHEHLLDLQRCARDLEDSAFNRVKLENNVHTLKDQLRFLQAVQEEELRELENLSQVDFDTGAFYKRELARAIDDIRRDFGTLSNAQKEQMTSYYETWIEEVSNNAKQEQQREVEESAAKAATTSTDVTSITSLGESVQRSAAEKVGLETENNLLQRKLRDMQTRLQDLQTLKCQREYDSEVTMSTVSDEIQSLRNSLQSASEGNISMRFEIMTYRRLLEIQETRLVDASPAHQQSDTSSIFGGVAAAGGGATAALAAGSLMQQQAAAASGGGGYSMAAGGGLSSPAVGGRAAASTASSTYVSASESLYGAADTLGGGSPYGGAYDGGSRQQQVSALSFSGSPASNFNRSCTLRQSTGDITIEEVDVDDRYIALKNISEDKSVDIGGYVIAQTDDLNAIRYEIPSNIRLKPRGSLRIYSNLASRYATTDDIVATSVSNWLMAVKVTTIICRPNGEQIAQLVMTASPL